MTPKRKPAVVAIRGRHDPDIITQEELERLTKLQDNEWIASRAAQKLALAIEARLSQGATIADGAFRFDADRHMARSKKPEKKEKAG